MNETSPFIFNGRPYPIESVVKIKKECEQVFGFNSILIFTGYIVDENVYCFSPLHDRWKAYRLSSQQIAEYVETVLKDGIAECNVEQISPEYIDGIVAAWTWYILIMFFALFFNGAENVIMTWFLATFIFFSWRHKKIKGG